ncbi:ABC transporter ATP-binding protein [Bacillus sp. FJAT-47783]|uniref:ABC transporter ATP-binding protein n=1 Tax=Bacillus sp. FJAT-47783 TaxID=2922712 RepID=UPI001FAB3EF3|nr:ABC transporter ATP-binding protein [Bacillus sp. FJAT-47783]
MKIEIINLSKTYKNGKVGLSPLQFNIQSGSIVALTGGNGAGKSTFIKLLTNVIRPSSGRIKWEGQRFSYMPDDLEFPPNLTAIEGLTLLGAIKNVDDDTISSLLKKVGLFDVRHQKIETFSKGMKQRLSFAQALLSDEEVLILDEPTNGLDPYWVKWFKNCLIEEKRNGRTIIFSTHHLHLVEELADEMLFFQDGNVIIKEKIKDITKTAKSLEEVIIEKLEDVFQLP